MIDRFTEKAREAIQAAAELAAQLDHGYVGTFVLQNGSLYDEDADVTYAPVMEADIPEASRTDLN